MTVWAVRWFTLLLTFQQALWIDVPFTKQDKNGCGSASIWMVMMYWKPDTAPDVDQIQQQLYSRQAGGIYAKDMARYFESHGYRAFAFRAEWDDLAEHIAKGRPLIVCLERNKSGVPLHYVVVAGIDPVQSLVLLNDPAQRKLLAMPRAEFERAWLATDNWALLAVPEIELASKAFREEKYSEAREHLTSAARLNPSDQYTNDFLATVYFLEDNTEAALKYWNRAGKPEIEDIRFDPPLRTDPILIDRALAFSRGSFLALPDFEKTQARLTALGVFSRYRMELSPADGDRFNLTLRAAEQNGTQWLAWARGLPFQTVEPEFRNIGGKAINLESIVRWDSNKQRAFVAVESPMKGDPKWRIRTSFDARDENWASPSGGFHLRKYEAGAELMAVPSGRWKWTSGARFSDRHLKYVSSVTRTLVRDAARHLNVDSTIAMEVGKFFKPGPARVGKLMNTTSFNWRTFSSKVQLGTSMGQLPFDERFMIGLDRDSDLWLRAHSALVDGRKNASNTSRNFVITNSDIQKTLMNNAWFHLSGGPFLDTGRSSLSPQWTFDTGIELRFRVLGSFGINLSYGRSLRDGSHALFGRLP